MDIRKEAHELFTRNRRSIGEHMYTVPSTSTYPHQWLWDSCFHAIVLALLEPEAAKKELLSLVSRQFPDGMIPHIIFWKKGLFGSPHDWMWQWGREGVSSITQPPMLAYAAWEIHRRAPDKEFLEKLYPSLFSYYRWLIETRDPRDHHLIGIINPDESGEDNSPRFDEALGTTPNVSFTGHYLLRRKLVDMNRVCNFDAELCMSKSFWVKDVPFNAILVKNLQVLGHIASYLGHKAGEHFAMQHQELIKDAMREHLFEDGVFWSTFGKDYRKLHVTTWAHFAPLFAGLYTKEEADALMEKHFTNPETLRSPFGIRTVSKAEPSYKANGFWRGPIWFAPHWFIYKGLRAYGYKEEAAFLARSNLSLLERGGWREYFNPETGQAYGARNFTWGALTLDMMEE